MKLFPRSFLWRTVLMTLIPLIIVQIIMADFFFGNHWTRVHASMARSLAGEVATMVNLAESGNHSAVTTMARDIGINYTEAAHLNRPRKNDNDARETGLLAQDLKERIKGPANIYIDRDKMLLFIDVPRDGKIMTFATSLRRVYSTSIEVFVLWLVISVLAVSILITPFIIIHARSIRRIGRAANRFGRGLDMPGFEPSGSHEIREAAEALIKMKDRLNQYNRTRTDMLNAVSHDLRAPLTRMRLAVETNAADSETMLADIDRMAEMVNAYLAFARGEAPEIEQETSLPPMLTRIARDAAGNKKIETHFPESPASFYAHPIALARAFGNIIENAAHYAKKKVAVTETDFADRIEITVDDDGRGIPSDKREDAMRPFVRLDAARGSDTGGTGLGLSIAQAAVEKHGGTIALSDSPLGGLRVTVVLPI